MKGLKKISGIIKIGLSIEEICSHVHPVGVFRRDQTQNIYPFCPAWEHIQVGFAELFSNKTILIVVDTSSK